jgi:hypothetical protein
MQNRGTAGNGVFNSVRAKGVIMRTTEARRARQRGCYKRTITARAQLKRKTISLVGSLKELVAKEN